ncbi:unnamed protein product [Didymodactylos carnosus]|uniref:Uncharacterized protein n=1 Tax=Didymodactylos carnosus TaxID=1234261 RepID=A0A8S2MUU7_9BILA|nr:unnamed protein product [Didymodactylos carnosus]CAF3966745.1 unnamed protein product [Didymodactylos carnosus]
MDAGAAFPPLAVVSGQNDKYSKSSLLSANSLGQTLDTSNNEDTRQLNERLSNPNIGEENDNEAEEEPRYSKLLRLLQQKSKKKHNIEENEASLHKLSKRFFFFRPDRRVPLVRNPRPEYTYGRKAHWDTFFG